MSGGVSYVWDPNGKLLENVNLEMVELEKIEEEDDIAELKEMISNHQRYTGSTVAGAILENWDEELPRFHKVMPVDYKRAITELKAQAEAEAAGEEAPVAAAH
jgi:glutamate synthase (NADPH/NADH) large chain